MLLNSPIHSMLLSFRNCLMMLSSEGLMSPSLSLLRRVMAKILWSSESKDSEAGLACEMLLLLFTVSKL